MIYATPDDYSGLFPGETATPAQLTVAQIAIDSLLRGAQWDDNDESRAVLRDAVCYQAHVDIHLENSISETNVALLSSASVGGNSYTFRDGADLTPSALKTVNGVSLIAIKLLESSDQIYWGAQVIG